MQFVDSFKMFGVDVKQNPSIIGKGPPTPKTRGAVGCQYMDTDTGNMYKCTAVANGVYTWLIYGSGGGGGSSDGTPVTHSWDGTVLSITSASGTSSADLKGEKGDPGAKGDKGDPGTAGADGFSPIVDVVGIQGGHRVTITDANGAKAFNVLNGKDGQGGAGGSTEAIIDVTELPTENINENAFYRLVTGSFVMSRSTSSHWVCRSVESLPEVGEPVTSDMITIVAYYNAGDNDVYGYIDENLSYATNVPVGWYTLAMLAPSFGVEWGGIITDIADDPNDFIIRLLLNYEVYTHKGNWSSFKNKAIIDVYNLPTNAIDANSFYRLREYKCILNGKVLDNYTCHFVYDFPESGESFTLDGSSFVLYWSYRGDTLSGFIDDNLSSEYGIPVGWHEFRDLAELIGEHYDSYSYNNLYDYPCDGVIRIWSGFNFYAHSEYGWQCVYSELDAQLKQNSVLYTAQTLTEEQQAQARQNIGAMENGNADSDLNMNGHEINKVATIRLTDDNDNGVYFYSESSGDVNEYGNPIGVLGFLENTSDCNVRLRYIADGTEPYDAATVRQAKQAGGIGYYSTTREEVGETHDNIKSSYIWGLYDALMEQYPDKVQKKEYTNDDGTFTNYVYEISTGEYATEGTYTTPDKEDDSYWADLHIKKPKYLLLNSIHGERKTALSTYRFIRDVLSGHNVPQSFREGVIISVMPVGTPSAFDAFTRYNSNEYTTSSGEKRVGVDINRNFDCDWAAGKGTEDGTNYYGSGTGAATEKETQAIVNWMADNTDAELYLDFHNSGSLNEKVVVCGLPDNGISDTAKKVALRGIDRIIPYWRDVIGYPNTVDMTKEDGVKDVRDVIYSYCASVDVGGTSIRYAQKVLGIRSIAIETASHYGDYSDWVRESYSTEAIAMGAEALGNILIEFYDQSCEVMAMSNVDSKLETLLERVNSGFRIEGGIYTQPATVNETTTVTIPCSNPQKVKAIEFYASEATEADIRANDYTANAYRYVMSAAINTFASGAESIINISGGVVTYGLKGIANIMTNLSTYGVGWDLNASASTITVGENGVSFNAPAIMQGTYNWTAYYWND